MAYLPSSRAHGRHLFDDKLVVEQVCTNAKDCIDDLRCWLISLFLATTCHYTMRAETDLKRDAGELGQ